MTALPVTDETALKEDWLRLRKLIVKAARWTYGYTEADLLKGVIAGVLTFWPGKESFIIASLDRFPKLTRVNMVLASGDHFEVARIEKEVVMWARSKGATQAFTEARVGLDRLNQRGHKGYYADSGYTRRRVVYSKEI